LSHTTIKTYPHAPITEATLELRVQSPVSSQEQQKVVRRLQKQYPHVENLNELRVNFDSQRTGGAVSVSTQPQGFRRTSTDQTEVALISPLGVTSARLAPYPGWNVFSNQALDVWKVWKRSTKINPVVRIGVRYINRIDIPRDGRQQIRVEDYLTIYPQAPELGVLPMTGYFIQIEVPTHDPLWTSVITSTVVPSPLLDHISLLLDIDVSRTEEIPMKDDDLWAVIAQAHDIKNNIFQRCITQQSERLFE